MQNVKCVYRDVQLRRKERHMRSLCGSTHLVGDIKDALLNLLVYLARCVDERLDRRSKVSQCISQLPI